MYNTDPQTTFTTLEISSSKFLNAYVTKIRIKSLWKRNGKAISHNVIKCTTNGALRSLIGSPYDMDNEI
jgi:hypothetical protein